MRFAIQVFSLRDKQLHFAAGTIAGALGYYMYQNEFGRVPQSHSILAGLATGFAAGIQVVPVRGNLQVVPMVVPIAVPVQYLGTRVIMTYVVHHLLNV
jgi:hypothetical protein